MSEQALEEPTTQESGGGDAISADDWAQAMAEQATTDAPAADPADDRKVPAQPLFEQFDSAAPRAATRNDIELIMDIPVMLTVELGRARVPIKNLLQLAQGSVVELDGLAGDPLDVLVNGCLIAKGEVVVVNEKFGIRLTDVLTPAERIKRLKH